MSYRRYDGKAFHTAVKIIFT